MIIFYFFMYSFIGWFYESTICSLVKYHRLINRGFLKGPYCPIYGFGAILTITLLGHMSYLEVFLLSMILSTVLEYTTAYILEKVFNRRWWDYSKQPFNIHGRICIIASLIFGLANVLLISLVHPFLSQQGSFNVTLVIVSTLMLAGLFVIDFFYSVKGHISLKATYKLSQDYFRLKKGHAKEVLLSIIHL